ncbi:MAG TPA: pyruvate kinase [Bacteroidales bacterium]|nr:pyruvate kinase [Bacteroidales bacterium]
MVNSHTRIVVTLGPASSDKMVLKEMINAGVDVFRLNFSHSTKEEHLKLINLIRELNDEMGTHVAILADLQGPKLRVGEIENNSLLLTAGDEITFVTTKCTGTKDHIYMSYSEFPADVNTGESILIDDGKIKLEVSETNKKDVVRAVVRYGGILSSHKGVNLPNTAVSLPCLTDEDISNAEFVVKHDVDWIALSFVRKASDISEIQRLIRSHRGNAGVIAKIEKPEALGDIDGIIEQANGIMVARGDLGVEIPFDEVPLIQKMIVNKCIGKSRPVIIATQMMESMILNFRPTRAEATDVANAVLEGADALMLSGETSVGKYPVETVVNMQRIIDYTENNGNPFNRTHVPESGTQHYLADSVCSNATDLARQTGAKAIITFTHSGYTAIRISSHRPEARIYAFTNNRKILGKLSLVWGVKPYYLDTYEDLDMAIKDSVTFLEDHKLLKKGDCVVHVGSTPLNHRGSTNMVKVNYV